MAESTVLRQILLNVGSLPYVRLWRNNTGQVWSGASIHTPLPGQIITDIYGRKIQMSRNDIVITEAHPVNFGLKGSGDIAGIIGPVGKALFIEAKDVHGRQSEQQKNFEKMVRNMGGIYILARSAEEAVAAINEEKALIDGKL